MNFPPAYLKKQVITKRCTDPARAEDIIEVRWQVAITVPTGCKECNFYSHKPLILLFSHIFLMPSDQNTGTANDDSTVLLKIYTIKKYIILLKSIMEK